MRKTIRFSWAALLAVLVSSTLICLMALTSAALHTGMRESVRTSISDADIVITSDRSGAAVPVEAKTAAEKTAGVTHVEPHASTILVATSLNRVAFGAQNLPDAPDALKLSQGRLPSSPAETLLVPEASSPVNLVVGSTLTVQGAGEVSSQVKVVGIAEASAGIIDRQSISTLMGTTEAVQQWAGTPGYQRLHVTTDGSVSSVLSALTANPVLRSTKVTSHEAYVTAHLSEFNSGARTITMVMRGLGLMALLAAFVVIGNTFSIKTAQRARQLALMRCLGATRRQVIGLVMGEAVATGLLGAIGGVLLAHAIAAPLLGHLSAGLPLRFQPSLAAVLVTLAVGVLATVAAALPSARRSTAIAPMQALRAPVPTPTRRTSHRRTVGGLAAVAFGVGLVIAGAMLHMPAVAACGGLIATVGMVFAAPVVFTGAATRLGALGGAPGKAAAQSLRRNPRRTGTVSITVWFGTMLITTVMVGAATAAATVSHALDESTPADVSISTSSDAAALGRTIDAMPGVAATCQVSEVMVSTDLDHEQPLTVVAWTSSLKNVVQFPAGVPEPTAGTIQLPSSTNRHDGDTVTLIQAGKRVALKARIVKDAPGVGIVTPTDYNRLEVANDAGLWVRLAPGTDATQAARDISQVAGPDATVKSQASERDEINQTLHRATLAVDALLAVVVLITLIGVSNTLSLSVVERTREVGLLRALGALRRQITHTVLAESVLTTSTATVLGTLFGIVFGLGGMAALLTGEQLALMPAVPWLPLLAIVLVSIPVGLLAAVVPARHSASIPPIAALASDGE